MKQQFTKDERGVSEVIGAILVFGLLIALMAIIQTQAIPAANQEVEFNHNQQVQGDLTEFHQRASSVAREGSDDSVSIQTGTTYPSRLLFFNPPPPTGTLSTSEAGTATLENVSAINGEVHDYLNGTTVGVDSRTLEYSVDYNEYRTAPTTRYEYGILYDNFSDSTVVNNAGSVIDGTDINLVFMAGNYSRSTASAQSVDISAVSAPARPVTVEGEGGKPIVLKLPTDLPISVWQDTYEDQDTVNNISDAGGGRVRIELAGDQRYTLKMAGLGLEKGVEDPGAHYIVPADDGVTDVDKNGNTTVAFEVRDKYNNPVDGVKVEIDLDSAGSKTVNTSSDGRAVMSVSPSNTGSATGTILSCPGKASCNADFAINVISPGGVINPSGGVRLQGSELITDVWDDIGNFLSWGPSSGQGVNMEFDVDNNLEFTSVRMNYYYRGEGNDAPPNNWVMNDGTNSLNGEVSGEFNSTQTLDPSSNIEVGFSNGNTTYDFQTNDFFVFTAIKSNGEQSIYFVSPEDP